MVEPTGQAGDALVIFGISGDLAKVVFKHAPRTPSTSPAWWAPTSCAVNIPLGELRSRLGELPRDREIHVVCRSGQRAYSATRILLHHGFNARNRSGGMLSRAILTRPGPTRVTA